MSDRHRRDTLEFYPQITVRVRCDHCNRRGGYRLTRLVEKYGCDIPLDELIKHLAHSTCGHRPENQRKGKRWTVDGGCKAYFAIDPPEPEPTFPQGTGLRVVEDDGTVRRPKKRASNV